MVSSVPSLLCIIHGASVAQRNELQPGFDETDLETALKKGLQRPILFPAEPDLEYTRVYDRACRSSDMPLSQLLNRELWNGFIIDVHDPSIEDIANLTVHNPCEE